MEKKRLGRGIEDIADIFLSQTKENIPAKDLISENAKKVALSLLAMGAGRQAANSIDKFLELGW